MWTSSDRVTSDRSTAWRGPDGAVGPAADLRDELQTHAVHALGVLDESPRPELEGIARLAARLCRTPWASINLIDAERQWSAAAHGIRPDSVPRCDSMCARMIDAGHERIATDDAPNHRLFVDSPFVIGPLGHLRTYAAAVIRASDGTPLGSLCVFSEDAVAIDEGQMESLTDLAASARALLELDRRATRLALLATIDPLTEVLNRRGFEDALVRLVSQARREGLRPGALLFDLDGFKSVNDTLGHAAGDELLRLVCGRLVSATRDEDVVARLGGDELAVLVPRIDEAGIEVARRRLLDVLRVPTRVRGAAVTPRASCGAAVWLGDDDEPRAMLDRADLDMYRDKELSRRGSGCGPGPRNRRPR